MTDSSKLSVKVNILIPVLREQKRIIHTLNYFLEHFKDEKIHIFVIATSREFEKKFSGPSTFDLVYDFILENKLKNKITLLNYPHKYGTNAHQFNFALKIIKDDYSFTAVYNADSRPHPNTFNVLSSELRKNPKAKVFQQPSLTLKNFNNLNSNKLINFLLRVSAILQTEFTLAHEIPAFIRQSVGKNLWLKKYGSAHCISHGLIINTGLLKSLKGFPEDTLLEDIFLGYLIRSRQVAIFPFPLLENADAPATLKGLWNQKYVWFWGPMRNISYFRYIIKNKSYFKINEIKVPFLLMLQGLWSALAWIASGFLVIFIFMSILWIENIWLYFLLIFLLMIHYPLRFAIIARIFPFLFETVGRSHKKLSVLDILGIFIATPFVIFFHSLPPVLSVLVEIKHVLFGGMIYRPKTDDV